MARPLARRVVAPLERTRITPNQVTLASLVVFLVGRGADGVLPGHGGLTGGVR